MLEPTSPRASTALAPLDRLSLLTSLVLIGLTLSLIVDLPSQRIEFTFLGSEASLTISGSWLIAVLLAALTAAGVNSIARTHPRVHLGETRYIFILWIVPVLIVVGATMVLSLANVKLYGAFGLIGVAFAGAFMVGVIVGEYITIDLNDRWYSAARLGVNLAVYLAALVLFTTIYSWKLRSLYSSTAIGVTAGLMALELLRGSESDFGRTWLYGAAVGLAMGEIVWALNYWSATGFVGGAMLLLFFYALTGITQQYLWNRLNRIVFVEFAMIVGGAMVMLLLLRPR
ncbi:MAG: hypothetical protein M1482_14005 [Chloroflexi bacterium]|nr:hypothetical protein [Chloroflexota bacterium]